MEPLCEYCCTNPASRFVLLNPGKRKACVCHLADLLKLKQPHYDIGGLCFITSAEDAGLYEARRREAETGLEQARKLEEACETEWIEAQKALERMKGRMIRVIEAAYAESISKIRRKYEGIQRLLGTIRRNLEDYPHSKEAQLSPSGERFVRGEVPTSPVLRVVMTDPSLSLVKVVFDGWKCLAVDQIDTPSSFVNSLVDSAEIDERQGLIQLAAEEREYAISLIEGRRLDKTASIRKELVKQLELSWESEEVRQVASDYSQKAKDRCDKGEFEKAERCWNKSLHLLLQRFPIDKQTAETSFQLGVFVMERRSRYAEAATAIRKSLEIQEKLKCPIQDILKTKTELADAMIKDEHLQEGIVMLQSVVDASKTQDLWGYSNVARSFLALAYAHVGRTRDAEQMLLTCADNSFLPEEEKARVQQTLGRVEFKLKRYEEAKKHYMLALEIYQASFPNSIKTANTFNNLGLLHFALKQKADAERCYRSALTIYEKNCPKAIRTGNTNHSLGFLYSTLNFWGDAEKCYKSALNVYLENFPNSIETGKAFNSLGLVYIEMQRFPDAEECFKSALKVYQSHFPNSFENADTLKNLGFLYSKLKRWEEEEKYYESALVVYKKNFPTHIETGKAFHDLGSLYSLIQRNSEAKKCYVSALAVFQAISPKPMERGNTLYRLGKVLEDEGEVSEAISKIEEAKSIWEYFGSTKATSYAGPSLELLYQKKAGIEARRSRRV